MHVDTVALVLSVSVLLVAQALLLQRSLIARRHISDEPPSESPARELMWAALPAILLLVLLAYSLRYAQII
jgi:heme/copper-type cytochrome/quinol oxidase subunit 2